ncbi:hypothetical protein [Mycobacterium avium]|uniref:hypothetical protein n=1 Tax=Mycobacterium avium TaxID=1764 RepID=UPI00111BDE5C|nr:hypothetical protein [Mycobacterium avium]
MAIPISAESPAPWLSEQEVAARSGLPGPLVAELLPRLPTPGDIAYDRTAALYTADSVLKAQIATCMLEFGVRYRYIRAAMFEPLSTAELEEVLGMWRKRRRRNLLAIRTASAGRAGGATSVRSVRWSAALLAATIGAPRNRFSVRAKALSRTGIQSVQHTLLNNTIR